MFRGLVDVEPGRFPVDAIAGDVADALDRHGAVVVVAPPGTGKTTRLPLLLAELGGTDRLLVTEPRRVATRAAAQRMASTLGERVGATVGYRMRDDVCVGSSTRIEVHTEGLFLRTLQGDPGLDGVSTVLFDEVHERSLDIDLSLALTLHAKRVLRPDLRIVVMSATIDAQRLSELIGGPIVATEAALHPVERWERPALAAEVASWVVGALHEVVRERDGDVLVFLPGAREIRQVQRALERRPLHDVATHTLTGSSSAAESSAALSPDSHGRRRVVLATAVAQTSLTVAGVRIVIDSGLARRSSFDARSGLSRLVTERVSRATATQRAGRAGREAPGLAVRLWSAAEDARLVASDRAEIADADLTDLVLQVAAWGETDPSSLTWIEPPLTLAWNGAVDVLVRLGALSADGKATALGDDLAGLPVPARLGRMLLAARDRGDAATMARAVELAAELLDGVTSAARLSRLLGAARGSAELSLGELAVLAFPDRLASQEGADPRRYRLASGGVATMLDECGAPPGSALVLALDLDGDRSAGRIYRAVPVTVEEARSAGVPEERRSVRRVGSRVEVVVHECVGAAVLTTRVEPATPDDLAALAWDELDVSALLHDPVVAELVARVDVARTVEPGDWPEVDVAVLRDDPLLDAAARRGRVTAADVAASLRSRLAMAQLDRSLDRLAPVRVAIPSGRVVEVDYLDDGGPTITAKLQEFFGAADGPAIASGRLPLRLVLVSPAGRPAAVTRDLRSFWTAGYDAVRKDLRGRYPKHPWPEDPTSAVATARAKPRANP